MVQNKKKKKTVVQLENHKTIPFQDNAVTILFVIGSYLGLKGNGLTHWGLVTPYGDNDLG